MIESRRRAYLDAMEIEVWSIKPPEPEYDRLLFRPGDGSTLLICGGPDATATRIAGDICRALGGEVVWAWPDPSPGSKQPKLEQAVGQYLFTRIIVFGAELGRQVFRGSAPSLMGSASISVTGSLDELAVRGNVKRAFWLQVSETSVN